MKKKEESKKRERKKEVVVAAVAIYPAKFQLCFLEVRKYETSKSCVWTRCSTQEYVAHNYILHKVLKYESRKKAPRLWTMPDTSLSRVLKHWFLFLGFVPSSTVLLRYFRHPFFDSVSPLTFPISCTPVSSGSCYGSL